MNFVNLDIAESRFASYRHRSNMYSSLLAIPIMDRSEEPGQPTGVVSLSSPKRNSFAPKKAARLQKYANLAFEPILAQIRSDGEARHDKALNTDVE